GEVLNRYFAQGAEKAERTEKAERVTL
ncbi:MAG: hypothetical protein K0S19_1832, partial [Geminicoccaceae bacterium]|nr:hypothetical protein [Geminicoccaceae bacterium]